MNIFNNTWLFEGLEEYKFTSIRNLVFKIISFIILILFVKNTNDYLIYAAINVIGTAGNYIVNMIQSNKYVRFSFSNLNFKRHLKSILYLVVVNLAIEIYTLIDVTMLSWMTEKENVAFYSYGIKIEKILITVINTFTMVIVPRLAYLYSNDKKDEFNKLINKTLRIIVIIAIPMIIGIQFVSDYIICKIYGDVYITSSYVLKILSLVLIISPVGYLLGSRVMLTTGSENKMIIPVSIGAIINVILNYILIQFYKEIGAAIASVVSELIVAVIYIILSRKKYKINKSAIKTFSKVIITGVIITLLLLYINLLKIGNLQKCIMQIFFASLLYLVMMYILKENIITDTISKIIKKYVKTNVERKKVK